MYNIRVFVNPQYDIKNSFPSENRFVFKYFITIKNCENFTIKILKRNWHVYDASNGVSETTGDGIIGLTPEVAPGQSFAYFSNVVLHSGVGQMSGKYLAENLKTHEKFEIEIPKFHLLSEVLSN